MATLPSLLSSLDDVLSLLCEGSSCSLSEPLRRLRHLLNLLQQSPQPSSKKPLAPLLQHLRRIQSQLTAAADAPPPLDAASSARELARCLGLLLLSWPFADDACRAELTALQKDLMAAAAQHAEIVEIEDEDETAADSKDGDDEEVLDVEDLVIRVKKGCDEKVGPALAKLGALVRMGMVGEEESGGVVSVLLTRLGSAKKNGQRLAIISLLRSLARLCDDNKEQMASIETLSAVVRSLIRDADESREAVGLLLDLSSIAKVRQRIGRVQGCIVMLVTLFNGDDIQASHDAGKLLSALSSNTQNVLLMAEAGYFIPLVQYLKEGSDMNKILMATAISRMELTDQTRATLGQEGCINPLVKMFTSGKLEAKLSALGALRNLSLLSENIPHLINSGIVPPLLQLLFSVTSVILTLREPASSILATLAQSELILVQKDVAQQMLSLLNLSSPGIQLNLLKALNSIAGHRKAKRIISRMKGKGALQLLLPFLVENNSEIRAAALNLLFNLSKDLDGELTELLGETHLNILVDIISTSTSEEEKAAAASILSNISTNDKKATEILARTNLLPVLISLLGASIAISSTPTSRWLFESIAGILIRFTVPSDKKLQRVSAAQGVIPCLVKILSDGSATAKSRAATSLAQLSQNSLALCKVNSSRWFSGIHSSETSCELHNGHCVVKKTFCLVKAGALSPLLRILEGKEREADEAVLNALETLMLDGMWEKGCKVIEKASGVRAIIRIVEIGNLKAQEKAICILEKIFRLETLREEYGAFAQVLLIDLAQKGDQTLKPMIAKILAHLQLLQMQSSYF
ncbi:U-box domain-containing protein 44-like [Iris pallida]|uniref:U-box domain-containing protein 44-like n=1 Tax=Iris pallida TaxID=29817 RepID=A0AAX6HBK9_IRIPA|nr:U-box domain-containing protein 44-like [Iris pallida]